VHDHVISIGGSVIHTPQHFPQYPGHYYATFWYDPFGISSKPSATTTGTEGMAKTSLVV
jgi:hypothetical protein